jgi:hypothetical protein
VQHNSAEGGKKNLLEPLLAQRTQPARPELLSVCVRASPTDAPASHFLIARASVGGRSLSIKSSAKAQRTAATSSSVLERGRKGRKNSPSPWQLALGSGKSSEERFRFSYYFCCCFAFFFASFGVFREVKNAPNEFSLQRSAARQQSSAETAT